jgi:hypothetical protein
MRGMKGEEKRINIPKSDEHTRQRRSSEVAGAWNASCGWERRTNKESRSMERLHFSRSPTCTCHENTASCFFSFDFS